MVIPTEREVRAVTDEMIVAAIALIGGLIAIVAPVVKLNSNITELTVIVRQLKEIVKEKTDKLDERVTKHGVEIDEIRAKQVEHESRIKQLER